MRKKNSKVIYVVFGTIAAIVIALVFVNIQAKRNFIRTENTLMERHVEIKTLEFNASMNSQLVLVRQMMKSPSIVEFMQNPDDEEIRKSAFKDFEAFSDSFLSKSVFWISKKNMEFWSGMKFSYVVDPNDPNEYWFNMTMYETEEYNFNINYNPNLGTTMLWLNAVVRDKNHEPIGIVGTGVPLTDFIRTMYAGLDENIEMYLYNDLLEITGAADESILKDKIKVTDRLPSLKDFDNVPKECISQTRLEGNYVLAPITLVNWHMVLFVPYTQAEFFKNAYGSLIRALLVIAVIVALSLAIVNIITQMRVLKDAIDELSSGNADLTKRIKKPARSLFKIFDEVVDSVNGFIRKLQEIVGEVKNARNELDNTGRNLKSCTQDTTNAISQISQIISNMGQSITAQTGSVEGTAGTVSEISTNINSLGSMINTQSNSVSQASAAVAQMVGNIESVNVSVTHLSKSFAGLQDKTQNGVKKQEDVNNRILKIQEQSQMLQDANKIISSIAEQTNLLAMNAAIEAAHAGEAGKGFSVVADEIRKLSENSSSQSKTIGNQLQNIQSAVTEIVTVSQESRDMLNSLSQDISSTHLLVDQITSAMQEQKNGSRQINESLGILNDNSNEVKSASAEMEHGNNAILDEIAKLKSAAKDLQHGMDDMSSGAMTITQTGEKLSALSKQMDESINNIGTQLDQFKV